MPLSLVKRTRMTRKELEILRPLIKAAVHSNRHAWEELRHETEHGPFFGQYPYHPAAMHFEPLARHLIVSLAKSKREALIAEWRRVPRVIALENDSHILDRYSM